MIRKGQVEGVDTLLLEMNSMNNLVVEVMWKLNNSGQNYIANDAVDLARNLCTGTEWLDKILEYGFKKVE
jgi:hypothetical protein